MYKSWKIVRKYKLSKLITKILNRICFFLPYLKEVELSTSIYSHMYTFNVGSCDSD